MTSPNDCGHPQLARVAGAGCRRCRVFRILLVVSRFCPPDVLLAANTWTVGARLDDVQEREHQYQYPCNSMQSDFFIVRSSWLN